MLQNPVARASVRAEASVPRHRDSRYSARRFDRNCSSARRFVSSFSRETEIFYCDRVPRPPLQVFHTRPEFPTSLYRAATPTIDHPPPPPTVLLLYFRCPCSLRHKSKCMFPGLLEDDLVAADTDVILNVQRWRPSTLTLDPLFEMVVKDTEPDHVRQRVSGLAAF